MLGKLVCGFAILLAWWGGMALFTFVFTVVYYVLGKIVYPSDPENFTYICLSVHCIVCVVVLSRWRRRSRLTDSSQQPPLRRVADGS